jgi:hypothetical protein
MAFENDQNEPALPAGGNSKRKSSDHLPRYYRTQANKKFLSSTVDQLIQPGVVEKINGYVGRKTAKAFTSNDTYISDVSVSRENYQFEPAAVIKDNLNNVKFYKDYNDYVNQLNSFNKGVQDHSVFNSQEYYAWDSHIDWDKFSNFREYYWLPNGPQSVPVAGNTVEVESNIKISIGNNVDNNTYIFSNAGTVNNPTITLYRGQTYKFEVDTPNLPFTIKTKRTLDDDFNLGTDSISVIDGVDIQDLEEGVSTIKLSNEAPDIIYYVCATDINAAGTIIVKDIEEATFIDIESEILGKRYYKSANGFNLSNGMKVYFTGDVEPAQYAEGAYYVEGVGNSIELIPEINLNVPSAFSSDIVLEFDNVDEGFDKLPYSSAIGYPVTKDYFVINRASKDGNLWSRYNRWFHRDVIEESARINNQPIEVDQAQRAKRPIIEFEAGLKLSNFGTFSKTDVDLVDDYTTDVFSIIEGKQGYNIDGIDVADGMRILFTADTDILVRGKIFEVEYINFASGAATNRQIHLKEVQDTHPLENEVVLVSNGNTYKGKLFYFDGTEWKLTQDKTAVNQPPLFDVFDEDGNSYSDTSVYSSNNFLGTKIFSYQEGSGNIDSELGIPISYRSIENVGDIVFTFNLLQDSFTYTLNNNIFTKNTDVGFLRNYYNRTSYNTVNGWKKAPQNSNQVVVRQYVFDNTFTNFEIDVYDNSADINDLWIRVYLNNTLQFEGTDYILSTNIQNNQIVEFLNPLNLDDVVVIKTQSSTLKNNNGVYEIPINLERNPLNDNLVDFTLGEVNDHVSTIVESLDDFSGNYPGSSNLRDLGPVSQYGRRFVQHSAPLNLSLYHIVDKDSNIIKSINFSRSEYAKFKRLFLMTANDLGYDGPVKEHVDKILQEINRAKTSSMPFFFSDMVPLGATRKNTYIVDDPEFVFFGLSEVFQLSEQSRRAVQVYLNGTQLVYGKDYTFNSDGFAIITATKEIDDIIEIYEYENTNGSYVPPTPTKLGLYPKYEPIIYVDDTYQTPTKVIQGHDGSKIVAYNDFRDDLILELEKRIYNNLKVEYDVTLFDIHDFVGGEFRNTGVDRIHFNKAMLSDFLEWSNLVETDYTLHNFFERTNRFTFNYKNLQSPSGKILPGFWRQIYKEAYDTDRPHTHPWEMLGFTVKPVWWEEVYGPAPYTKDNLILWQDLEAGIVREPNKKIIVKSKYKRSRLTSHIPVDESGKLLPPVDSGYIKNYTTISIDDSFVFGDGAPVESAWRNSSEYPFSLLKSMIINNPSKVFATGFDRIRQVRNSAGQIVYSSTNKRIRLLDLVFPTNTLGSTTQKNVVQTYTSGLVNYVANYMASDVLKSYSLYKENIANLKNQIGFKIGGFTDKDKFKLILDSRTPLNEGNVFVPDENYQLFLNTSSPIETISYSGVIIERRDDGYVIKGYDRQNTSFKYHRAISTQSDPSINIGGISEPYLFWSAGKQYIPGTNVEFEGSYYRVKTAHTSSNDFDTEYFSKLPYLPLVGGRDAVIRKSFIEGLEEELPYGTLKNTVQEVVDFLLGYGNWLESKGFVFDYFDGDSGAVLNWRHSVNEFLFWTTQNWSAGSVIALSPSATRLKLQTEYSTVDNVFDSFYGYTLLKSDGNKLVEEFSSLGREPNEFVLQPKNTEDGIYSVRLPLIQKEHVCLIDNKTVFGDIIYDLQPGYRQERIKVLGYKTSEWDGSLNIPGFMYDNVVIEEWEPWKDYLIGEVVKYKEFYYSANTKIPGEETFTASNWNRLSEKPEAGLYSNFEYKTNQFADFYDLDSDNFDTEQQRLAQHLIGYQKRDYLENIINDSVSQYKFYQGFIADKGTSNALTKLFDALASDNKDSLEFYEEWAVKDGQYGASDGFDEIEFKLDETKFRLTPQPIELVNRLTGDETDLIYRMLPGEVYVKNSTYDHTNAFPEKNILDTYVKNAGYVNQQDVLGITTTYADITNFFYSQVRKDAYIWVGNDQRSWNVYKHVSTPYVLENVSAGTDEFTITVNGTPKDIVAGDVIGIGDLYHYVAVGEDSSVETSYEKYPLEGFFEVKSVSNNKIVLLTDTDIAEIENVQGSVTKFIKVRSENAIEANTVLQKGVNKDDLIWIDNNGNNRWNVLKNTQAYTELQTLSNSISGSDHNYGSSISVNDRNTTLVVGAPDKDDGKVYVYNRPSNSVNYIQTQIIYPVGFGDDNERFGASVAISPDGEYLIVGSPNASNVKTKYTGEFIETTDYGKGSIVLKDQSLWEAVVDIQGQEDNITFNSFSSTTQAIENLGIETDSTLQGPALLVGNYAIDSTTGLYAFPNIPTDHYLVRVPLEIYEGSGTDDEIKLSWNTRTYSNQDLTGLFERQPFNGDYPLITDEYLEETRTIKHKVDVILYINSATNVPVVGDILQTNTGNGTVAYVFSDASETVIYLNEINGSFNSADSLFRIDGDFIGEYEKQGPVDDIDTSDYWGGYWFIQTGESYTPTTLTNTSDEGKALVYYDVISDSTATGRFYYNSLDFRATTTESQNTIGSYIRVLSYQGSPGPNDVTGEFLSDLFVVRAPKQVTDTFSADQQINLYVNQLPQYGTGIIKDLADINLSTAITNKAHTINDIWDGYINFDFTKFDAGGSPFEPKVGLTVRDRTRGGTAEVAFYQRSGLNVTIFVKNVTGNWSVGDDFGQNAEIEFLGVPGDPNVIYQVDRIMGQIQFTGLGYAPAGIGGLLVLEAPSNIAVPAISSLIDVECWIYNESDILGIPRPANPPAPNNNEWKQTYKIPADSSGTASGLTNEGLYSLYTKSRPGVYDLVGSYTVPEKQNNFFLGNEIKITKFNDLYRAFIHAAGEQSEASPGRIYMLKNGTENNLSYNWEYAKNKKFKGAFNESLNYFTDDIVYLDNPNGTLYVAKTNIAAGAFDTNDWTSTDDVVDYVGFIPNNTGLSVINDSTVLPIVLDQTNMYNFGADYDISKNGDVLIVSALYNNSEPNRVIVYRSNNGFFERRQEILAPNNTSGFGQSISISDNGMLVAIGAPYDDEVTLNQGVVYIYKQVDGIYQIHQTLNSPNNERGELFGWNLEFDGETLAITARNANSFTVTTIDKYSERLKGYNYINDPASLQNTTLTTFDGGFTSLKTVNDGSGVVYVYENYNENMLFAQIIQIADSDINYFGRNLHVKNNHVYVGLPLLSRNGVEGQLVDFRRPEDSKVWSLHRSAKPTVDIDKIKKAFLYDTVKGELLTHLDYIDPLQGKVSGQAEQDISFKTYYDPATYTTSDGAVNSRLIVDRSNGWGKEHVGEVWWNLSTAKFYNPYQDTVIYSTQNWNKLFVGNSVDVYEWVESDVLPSVWDERADTNQYFSKGYSGTSLYGDSVYSTRSVYDSVAQTFKTKYYFWVSNKKNIPNVEFRNIKLTDIKSYIEDPAAAGLRFVTFISPTEYVLYNCDDLIKGSDVALSVQYYTIENQTQNLHNQYQIISEGLETSLPKNDIVRKWFDSLVGYDDQNRKVPDPALSPKYKYGTLFNPRQSWFVNRIEALKQFIERVNSVLTDNLIIDDKDITPLFSREVEPSAESRVYDTVADTLEDLDFIGVAKAAQASLTPVIEDGKIVRVIINNTGRGYRVAPTVTILGNGSDAVIQTTINNLGQITSATVVESGTNYDSNTRIIVRKFTVLVKNDSTIQNKWALYERLTESGGSWNRIKSQAYDVTLFWNYIDWYADGYSELSDIDYLIDNAYELTSLENNIGDIVKISNVGTGGWLLLEKIDNQESPDYTVNYKTIGRQHGTIELKDSLYNFASSSVGFDTISFDTRIYDSEPVQELRIVLDTIQNNLLIDDLLLEFNKLFFASIRFVFAEQPSVDWVFKTSFIKAKHNVGQLRKDITFNNDNLPSYESYVKEVKPFATKIREYLSAYEGLENTQTVVTDFDLSPKYNFDQKRILPESVKVFDNTLVGIDADFETYPNKNWLDNSSFKVVSVDVVDSGIGYTAPPELIVEGGGGSGAELQAFLGRNGRISNVKVINPGSGYYSSPTVIVNGNITDEGRPATLSVKIGDSPVRNIHTIVKFDRVTGTYLHTVLNQTETFNGTGSKYEYLLKWPMDLLKTNVTVTVNGIELLESEYSYTNVLDTSKGYDRYFGQITFTEAPASNVSIVIDYKKSINLLEAHDRINNFYNAEPGKLGKDLGQLMDGIDYGGVEVKSFGFQGIGGWDDGEWYSDTWDTTYDTTYEDEIFEFDGSTIEITLSKPLENGIVYNIYYQTPSDSQPVRIDDPNFDGSTVVDNPNAIMQSLVGDGVTQTMYLDDFKLETYQEDGNNTGAFIQTGSGYKLIIRKSTSDGTFNINPDGYDTLLSGGDLNYSTATGLAAEDITVDGDGFVTPATAKGPEELVPGQILDTVDIQVYERPSGGASQITSRVYIGDGSTNTFDIGSSPILQESIFVKVGYEIKTTDDYSVDYTNNTLTLTTTPASNEKVSIVTLGVSGTNILDIDQFIADGTTSEFLTNVRWSDNISYYVTINGVKQESVIYKSDETFAAPNNIVIKLASAPDEGSIIRFAIFENDTVDVPNFSEVLIDNFVADGSTTSFELSQTPFSQEPAAWFTIVKINNNILNAGYNKRFITTASKLEYKLDEWQLPAGTVQSSQLRVFLNGVPLEYIEEWTFVGNQSTTERSSTLVRLKNSVQQSDGDVLDVYVLNDGEYRFGTFDINNEYTATPGVLQLDSAYNDGDIITVYQFSNHDSQGFERQQYDVVDRFNVTNLDDGSSIPFDDATFPEDWHQIQHLRNGLVALREEAIDAQYVWVSLNGILLTPNVDYYVTDNKRYVKITATIAENDTIEVIQFANPIVKNRLGWRQFKDMLNRTHYKRLDGTANITLQQDLNWYDNEIVLINADSLDAPQPNSKTPSVIFIEGERIEYFIKDGNKLKQLRRGTLGTGVKNVYLAGTEIYSQSTDATIPYKDETITTVLTADGTSKSYSLDFIAEDPEGPGLPKDTFEVFVAGRRLRKNAISSYTMPNPTYQDSPDGDETLPAEFTVEGNLLTLLETPLENQKIIIVRRQGKIWNEPGTPLSDADTDISRFLRAKSSDLPR